jgi:hypothetical protein
MTPIVSNFHLIFPLYAYVMYASAMSSSKKHLLFLHPFCILSQMLINMTFHKTAIPMFEMHSITNSNSFRPRIFLTILSGSFI